ncbi:RNA-directed DNA polymerase, eukaryota [Tanacetum coccineum]|uniref:RNA-directed DNA polymerase, eukaryota n=1 Tax=Tanacetum coccineum TaxID=301880 RepID=A0ABQ5BRV4_9ASTR
MESSKTGQTDQLLMSSRSKFSLGYGETFGSDEVFDPSAPSIFDTTPEDVVGKPLYDRFVKAVGMHDVPSPSNRTFMPPFNKAGPYDTSDKSLNRDFGFTSCRNRAATCFAGRHVPVVDSTRPAPISAVYAIFCLLIREMGELLLRPQQVVLGKLKGHICNGDPRTMVDLINLHGCYNKEWLVQEGTALGKDYIKSVDGCDDLPKIIRELKPWGCDENTFKTGINSHNAVEYSKPSLVLDESCFHNYDFSLSLVGQLKEFGSLPNLKKILKEEGKIFWIRVKEVIGWAPDFLNSHDDSSASDDESAEGKSKDVYSEKVSEAGAVLETIFKVEEPYLNATIQSKGEPKYPLGFTPRDTSDINSLGANNQVHDTSEKEHGSKLGFKMMSCWGNLTFDFVVGPPVGNSGGILCVWDINMFHKENSTVSDYFIAIMGKWIPNDKNLLIISVYAPQELSEKRMLWQYLVHVIEGWKGDVIFMGDFNKVRTTKERFGSIFNTRGAAAFNSFISTGGLVEVPLGQIRLWVKDKKDKEQLLKNSLKKKIAAIDSSQDKGDATSDALEDRLNTMNNLTNLERMESLELA